MPQWYKVHVSSRMAEATPSRRAIKSASLMEPIARASNLGMAARRSPSSYRIGVESTLV